MKYRHYCKKCGLTWFDEKEKSGDCDCPKPVTVKCLECGFKWKTTSSLPQCSQCNSVDIEPVEEVSFHA